MKTCAGLCFQNRSQDKTIRYIAWKCGLNTEFNLFYKLKIQGHHNQVK